MLAGPSMERLALARVRRLLCKPTAPLELTRNPVIVAVHLCSRTILQEVHGLTTRCHLRAVGSPVAPVLSLRWFGGISDSRGWFGGIPDPRDWFGCISDSRSWFGSISDLRSWFGGFHPLTLSVLLVPRVAVRANRNQKCNPDECGEARSIAPRVGPPGACVHRPLSRRLAIDTNSLRPSVVNASEFVPDRLTDGWTRSVPWKGAEVNEQLATAVCRSDEPEATIVVPGSESAGECH